MGNYSRAAKSRISGRFINDVDSTGLLPYKLTNLVCSPNAKWIPFSKAAQHLKMPFDSAKGRTDAKLRIIADGRNFSPTLSLMWDLIAFGSNTRNSNAMNSVWEMKKDGIAKSRIAYVASEGEIRMPTYCTCFSINHVPYLKQNTKDSLEVFRKDSAGNQVKGLNTYEQSEYDLP